jgi:glutathione synthase/RimK-type ligase-like ATP-grasp enzyme
MRLGIVTCGKCSELTPSEQKLLPLLEQYGIKSTAVVWNDSQVNWKNFDAFLVRSIWDYHLHVDSFISWLANLESLGTPTWNPIPVLRKNHHKFYLRELQNSGVNIIPSLFLEKGNPASLDDFQHSTWKKAVIKPAVSASAWRTETISSADSSASKAAIDSASGHGDFLIQKFMPEVQDSGELSLIFFNNKYSHAVLKQPKSGEFRVQTEYGGGAVAFQPEQKIIETAAQIISHFGNQVLYARVDGIVVKDEFVLMELELIEPELFLDSSPGAHSRFAEAIVNRLKPA